jgi:hypothetical protein
MIKIENVGVTGWMTAIRGMRNSWNSWDESDSDFCYKACDDIECENCMNIDNCRIIGDKDLELMKKLIKAGSSERKFLRFINVTCDIVAPLYWWKEFDTYKVGTVRNSCSTMHKIAAKEFTLDDFSHEQLTDTAIYDCLENTITFLNTARQMYIEKQGKSKAAWWQMIQLLPSSYNQRATVQLNYEVLMKMYHERKAHKLDEWNHFCAWVKALPYMRELLNDG